MKAREEGLGPGDAQLPFPFPAGPGSARQWSLGDAAQSGTVHPGSTRATHGVLQLPHHLAAQPQTSRPLSLSCPNSRVLPTDREDREARSFVLRVEEGPSSGRAEA